MSGSDTPRGILEDMRFLTYMNGRRGRTIRLVAGVGVLAAAVALGGGIGVAIGVLGVALVATSVLGVCPINPLFGLPMRACSLPTTPRTPGH